ncbi:MATE family efflux transporter [Lachnospira pectinoschiza]|uniref:MATE family efflux transporter n=1 Tax=Lachnospira pectinoschiza TaxID=28052 RepID=UPI001D08CBAE|nr:MATE family efflux transporter [Lachnospira pectinoschiza]MCB6142545.1 MATE family efflux transporter [Lachnospira pectinoschiza]
MGQTDLFGTEKISKILLKLAPPVMLAQLIQALYNIIDSLFVGRYSDSGLTALSIIYPLQLLMIALAVGTGVGINTVMAAKLGVGNEKEADEYAGVGTPLAGFMWLLFAVICWFAMPFYAKMSTNSEVIIHDVIVYGRIVCVFSFGLFLESIWTKVLQSCGDMKTPMTAQIIGAITNIVLDPLLIFGMFGFPKMGIAGAAVATVSGQIMAALIVMKKGFRKSPHRQVYPHHIAKIFQLGIPNILMQSAYTFYILGLNLILATFSDQAVTALGLYYKWQTFFFIPLGAMQTCIVPVISYNYAARNIERCKKTLSASIVFGMSLMALGTLCFVCIPSQMLRVFTSDELVIAIGRVGFRFVGISFLPMVTSLIFPVFFQAVGSSLKSSLLTVIRTVILFVPLAYLFSRFGLNWFWLTYPVTEVITSLTGAYFYRQFLNKDYVRETESSGGKNITDVTAATHISAAITGADSTGSHDNIDNLDNPDIALKPSKPGVIITIAREHGSSGKQIGKCVANALGIPFYYKEMITLAAKESGLNREFISDIHKNSPDIMRDLYLSSNAVQYAIKAQDAIIREIAENGSCVIVGRAADYILKDYDNVVRIFIHAPQDYRIQRVMDVYGDTPKEARVNIERSDKARASYYEHISGTHWGDARNYELTVDSSDGVEKTAQFIVRYITGHTQTDSAV